MKTKTIYGITLTYDFNGQKTDVDYHIMYTTRQKAYIELIRLSRYETLNQNPLVKDYYTVEKFEQSVFENRMFALQIVEFTLE